MQLQVPITQLAKMSFDLKFVELTADIPKILFFYTGIRGSLSWVASGIVGFSRRE